MDRMSVMDWRRFCLPVLLFVISLGVHVIDLNAEGRTWDEQFKIDTGYAAITAIKAGDYREETWNQGIEHPMVAKYIYGLASLPHRRTITRWTPVTDNLEEYLRNGNFFFWATHEEIRTMDYDLTIPRLVSAAANAATVVATYVSGLSLVPPIPMFLAAVALTTTPRFLAMGRLVTFESLTGLWFMLTVVAMARLLTHRQNHSRWYILVGGGVGLLVWTRYNNVMVIPFLMGWWILWHAFRPPKRPVPLLYRLWNPRLLLIPLAAGLVGFATWPLLWMRFPHYLLLSWTQNISRAVVSLYHLRYFWATTPSGYLALFIAGCAVAVRRRRYADAVLLWAILSTILIHIVLASERGHTRYMMILYPSYAVAMGIGLEQGIRVIRLPLLAIILLLYALSILVPIHPYYLDYYAEQVGGIGGAVRRGYEVYWWGEGQREAGMWLRENAKPGETVALQVSPKYVFPRVKVGVSAYPFGERIDGSTTYLVVSRSDFIHVPPSVLAHYEAVFTVQRENVSFVTIFKRKTP